MPTKDDEANEMAQKHYQVETGLTHVIRITRGADAEINPQEPIKLLEVNENTVPSGIMPIQFAPAPAAGIHYPIVIVEVTPEEFHKIQTGELKLPHDWKIGEIILRSTAVGAQ